MPLDLARSDVDPDAPAFQPMLRDLQANILKGHGRNFAHFIFLQFRDGRVDTARQWIAGFATDRITSAFKLERDRHAFKSSGRDGGAVFTLSISASGYAALGFGADRLPLEMGTPANQAVKDGPAFPGGAKKNAAKLGDGDVNQDWDAPFRGNVDALVMIADNHPDKAQQLADIIIGEAQEFSSVLLNQKGHVLRRQARPSGGVAIEHFGYADGVSQPLYFQDEIAAQAGGEQWNDAEPLNLVLVPDPNGRDGDSFGSFLVFRKLEQNVAGFMKAEEAIAPIRDSDGIANRAMSGAMMIGRFRNGNPLIASGGFTGDIRSERQVSNDFDYRDDAPPQPSSQTMYSGKCPFFAHIRITNPRADITVLPLSFVHSVRMTRRAMPYQDVCRFGKGRENQVTFTDQELSDNRPEKDVGLLFMSYQAHIGRQFEFIQNNWANHGHIAGRNIGPDGVIGRKSDVPPGLAFQPATPDLQPRRFTAQWGEAVDPDAAPISFGGFVRNKGGEYFFTPSISFLLGLRSGGKASPGDNPKP